MIGILTFKHINKSLIPVNYEALFSVILNEAIAE